MKTQQTSDVRRGQTSEACEIVLRLEERKSTTRDNETKRYMKHGNPTIRALMNQRTKHASQRNLLARIWWLTRGFAPDIAYEGRKDFSQGVDTPEMYLPK